MLIKNRGWCIKSSNSGKLNDSKKRKESSMKNRKKKIGFTLIELLAVIIVLAIIALIATPIIFNVIENAKLKS